MFENLWHDNCVAGSTQFPHHDKNVNYLGFKEITIDEELKFGSKIHMIWELIIILIIHL